jgi:3-phosphoshikimate 1-carboxyvinyltransferase
MAEAYRVQPAAGPLSASIRPPGSKSITNRALPCAALAGGASTLEGALDSEDTQVMVECLRKLGVEVDWTRRKDALRVVGAGGPPFADKAELFVGNSGTTIRFLAALCAAGRGSFFLDGVERMRKRPIGDLLSALNQLGGEAYSQHGDGCPPVAIRGQGLRGGAARVRGDTSSQFLSGLLIAAPYAESDVELIIDGPLVSRPYVDMTIRVMDAFGVTVEANDARSFRIEAGQRYEARRYAIEPDASAASYFWGAAAVAGGRVTVLGLDRQSLQGDVAFCDALARMGCQVEEDSQGTTIVGGPLVGVDIDMNAISDTVQTLAVVALFAEGPTTIRNVAHIRHKETDRIGDLARELRKLGAAVDEFDDGLRITPGPFTGATIETYRDHRMAMSFALAGLRIAGVTILDPACTQKTYPQFFADFEAVCGVA